MDGEGYGLPCPGSAKRRPAAWWAAGLIAAAALATYHNSLRGPLVFDDHLSIEDNPTIRRLWPIWPVLLPPAEGTAVNCRPVTNLSLAVNFALGGTAVWGYHAFNLAAHLLAALTLFGVVRRSLRLPVFVERFGAAATPLALFATLIWTVHPLQTNAVTYIIQRTEVLSGLFYLLTLYCVIRGAEGRGDRGQGTGDRPRVSVPCPLSPVPCPPFPVPFLWYAAAVVSCLLALGSKESAVSAPVVVLVYDRLFLARSWREVAKRRWALYLALAATWGLTASLLVRAWLTPQPGAAQVLVPCTFNPWLDYALLQFRSITWYLRLCFWPSPLILDYGPGRAIALADVLPYAALVLALAVGTAVSLRRWPGLGFLGLWFFAILAPSSGVVPITPECAAEKRMYLPLAAVVLLVVAGTYRWAARWLARHEKPGVGWHALKGRGQPRRSAIALGYLLAAAVIAVLAVVSINRNKDYRTERVLWQDTAAKRPGNARASARLAAALADEGQCLAALPHYQRALRLDPNNPEIYNNLGNALYRLGRTKEAIAQYQEALRLNPDYVLPLHNLGNTLCLQGKPAEAIAYYQRALDVNPDYVPAHSGLGNALCDLGKLPEAITHYRRAIGLVPEFAEAHNNLGNALLRLGRTAEAIACYRRAIELKPGYEDAHDNLRRAQEGAGASPAPMTGWERVTSPSGPGAEIDRQLAPRPVTTDR
jgi:tetratricopeptide (TPR) repeat protein